MEFKKFLAMTDKPASAELDVHLVCDNYATHNTPEIKAWLRTRDDLVEGAGIFADLPAVPDEP
ncbi:hypothetical protein [Streptosporangium sp. NPDC000396]|uniref:hypothetical protein n=1 Tax=Streptosporangium sp. NPDC000396 TaxID=3366185 RepID=UPI0036B9AEC0